MIDSNGKEVTTPLFEDVDFFISSSELAAAKVNGKWGFINMKGEVIIEPKYEQAKSFSCGLAPAIFDGLWGYIDKSGSFIIKPQFKMAKPFNHSGVAAVLSYDWRLISLQYYSGGN